MPSGVVQSDILDQSTWFVVGWGGNLVPYGPHCSRVVGSVGSRIRIAADAGAATLRGVDLHLHASHRGVMCVPSPEVHHHGVFADS